MKRTAVAVMAAVAAAVAVAQQQERAFVIRTGRPSRQTISQTIRKTGSLVSPAEVAVSAKVAGRLVKLELADGTRLEEGVKVKAGDVIAEIDARDYRAQLEAAKATVASAEATVKDAKREFDRASTLFKEGTATEQERDQAEASYERAVAALAQARAQEQIADINLGETVIVAPMDGVVSKRAVEPGTLLTAGAQIATITQMNPLRFQLALPTTIFSSLSPGKTHVSIEVDAYPDQPIDAVVSRVYPVADDATRTVRVETTVDNATGRLVPGMYAVGALDLDRRENVLCVPFDAVIKNDKERIVYRVADGVAHAVKVTLGVRSDAIVEIVDGLADTDEIVLAGQHRLTDGASVKREEKAQ